MKLTHRNLSKKASILIWGSIIIVILFLDVLNHLKRDSYNEVQVKWTFYSLSSALILVSITVLIYTLFWKILKANQKGFNPYWTKYILALLSMNIAFFCYRFYGPVLLDLYSIQKNITFHVGLMPYIITSLFFSFLWGLIYIKPQFKKS